MACNAIRIHYELYASQWIKLIDKLTIRINLYYLYKQTKQFQLIAPKPFGHDDVIKWKHFLCYWPFVRGIHQSLVNSLQKGQCYGALKFSLICTRINGWVNGEAGDLRCHRAHYEVTVMHSLLVRLVQQFLLTFIWFTRKANPPQAIMFGEHNTAIMCYSYLPCLWQGSVYMDNDIRILGGLCSVVMNWVIPKHYLGYPVQRKIVWHVQNFIGINVLL